MRKSIIFILSMHLVLFFLGCTSKNLYKDKKGLETGNKEFEELVKVEKIEPPPILIPPKELSTSRNIPPANEKTKKKRTKKKTTKKKATKEKSTKKKKVSKDRKVKKKSKTKTKNLKDGKSMKDGSLSKKGSKLVNERRPAIDPFRVGEKTRLSLNYFHMSAGYMDIEVLPFIQVNGKKSYHFNVSIKSNKFFSMFYGVDDRAETYVDYEELKPYTLSIHVKESKQLKEIRTFFDWKTHVGKYWETKRTKEKGEQERKKEWSILPYSQNVISGLFYLRTFDLKPGKTITFAVGDDGKNIMFHGDVLRKEKISTDIGEIDTVVMKPNFEIKGSFKPVGDIFLWFTDDEYHRLVRIQSKIKIGTIVGEVISMTP